MYELGRLAQAHGITTRPPANTCAPSTSSSLLNTQLALSRKASPRSSPSSSGPNRHQLLALTAHPGGVPGLPGKPPYLIHVAADPGEEAKSLGDAIVGGLFPAAFTALPAAQAEGSPTLMETSESLQHPACSVSAALARRSVSCRPLMRAVVRWGDGQSSRPAAGGHDPLPTSRG